MHYDSAEHIIPAGLGGIQKLPREYVSREFNHQSSKQERVFIKSSIIALPRQLLGPGKRGSMNPSKATKSTVNVFSKQPLEDSFSLGYIQQGKPRELPYIVWNSKRDEFTISIEKTAKESDVAEFKRYIAAFKEDRVRMISHPELDSDTYILGVQPGLEHTVDFYIASQDGITHPFTQELLREIDTLIVDKATFTGAEAYHVRTHQTAVIGNEYYTCCAKIAFNALAFIQGKDFVLQPCFDPLRKWIAQGGDNQFVRLAPELFSEMKSAFPVDSHYILFTKTDLGLVASVSFYDNIHNLVWLSEEPTGGPVLDGFICDWRQRRELHYNEYMAHQVESLNGMSTQF
ncbi:hypothetical protein PK28_17115 (plasmid) [Hymenobacter sp. DG25B]|uniref:hypothetical protein n=1 Tax=Hymenobacter sp. DG25B TaxID=1385664 RepID=UPI00054098D4|nr:hypothetical protein [Hymenobacter sp. DG25B]AIZ65392.1 hypothetical protein PK28_17115 [Hymenobacter sp. DG25B]